VSRTERARIDDVGDFAVVDENCAGADGVGCDDLLGDECVGHAADFGFGISTGIALVLV